MCNFVFFQGGRNLYLSQFLLVFFPVMTSCGIHVLVVYICFIV